MAHCQVFTGDWKAAALHFYQADQKTPSPALKTYAEEIKNRLSPNDQAWLEQQLRPRPAVLTPATVFLSPAGPSTLFAGPTGPLAEFRKNGIGFRGSLGMDLWKMDDLDEEEKSVSYMARQYRKVNPNTTYEKNLPLGTPSLEINPFGVLGNVEIGGRFTYSFHNQDIFKIADLKFLNYFNQFTIDIDTYSAAGSGRYYFKIDPRSRIFLEPSLGIQTLHLVFDIAYQGSSSNPSAADYGYVLDAAAFTAGLKAGINFMIQNQLSFSLAAGYSYARFENLQGSFFDHTFPNRNNIPGKAEMVPDAYWGKKFMWFVPEDPNLDGLFYNSPAALQDSRPLVIDLSALRLTMDLAFIF